MYHNQQLDTFIHVGKLITGHCRSGDSEWLHSFAASHASYLDYVIMARCEGFDREALFSDTRMTNTTGGSYQHHSGSMQCRAMHY
jgi:hypothetical protein